MENKECCHCEHCQKTKERSPEEYRALMNRIKRIQGQLRGIESMLENSAYCTDIMVQTAAVTAALNSFNKQLLASHIKSCVAQNIREGNDEVIDELLDTLQKLMK
ncbi:MAG: metal-sensing transcriptional repressor [Oscillospiraceae bacterium]|nr:metal-sensing transcriptional repressor [Oscillospiraceae bacterium]